MPRLLPKAHCPHCGDRQPVRDLKPVEVRPANTRRVFRASWCPPCVRANKAKPWFRLAKIPKAVPT